MGIICNIIIVITLALLVIVVWDHRACGSNSSCTRFTIGIDYDLTVLVDHHHVPDQGVGIGSRMMIIPAFFLRRRRRRRPQ